MAAFPIVKTPEDKEASPDNLAQVLLLPLVCRNWLAVPNGKLFNDKDRYIAFPKAFTIIIFRIVPEAN